MAKGNTLHNLCSENEDSDEDDMDYVEEEDAEVETNCATRVYLPNHEHDKDQELECDESAYICYHALKTGAPCLSFDIIPDNFGDNRTDAYPLSMILVGGTEVGTVSGTNSLLVMRLSNMHKNIPKEEEDSETESEDDEENEKPVLECVNIRHKGSVNRVKVAQVGSDVLASSWSELGKVHIWNLLRPISVVNDSRLLAEYNKSRQSIPPLFTFSGHLAEGFSMDWSSLLSGVLATGDVKSNIHLWKPLEGGRWHVDQRPYTGHTDSVEDLQWSPTESNVLASCSTDKSIRVWDVRAAPNKACMLAKENAHDLDVNAISWNKSEPFILSGGDDGKLRVWDLRQFPDKDPICTFKYHTAPITSVEWHPADHSVFAASSEDNVISQWDLALERDSIETEGDELSSLPPQLLFLHQGQKEIKELHWHRQMPGVLVSTALSGFNVFRTVSV